MLQSLHVVDQTADFWKLRICKRQNERGLIRTSAVLLRARSIKNPTRPPIRVQSRRMRSQQVRAVSPRWYRRSAENAWWSLEWSPREKEPPAVGIGGGKLPSCTSTHVPAAPTPFSLLRPRPRARWGPNVHRHPSVPSAPPHGSPHHLTAAAVDRVGSCYAHAQGTRRILLQIGFAYKRRGQVREFA